jgi:acetyl esterase/lipase
VDASKVVVLGHSAGGHLAICASGTQNDLAFQDDAEVATDVSACVAFYPPAEGLSSPVLGPDPTEELRRGFSPINYVKAGVPQTILLHGTADQTISVNASLKLYEALRSVGAPVELHIVEGVTHIFDSHQDLARASAVWIDLFLDRHVVNPRSYPSTEPTR